MTKLLIQLITWYQHHLSPDHSAYGKLRHPYGFCRFAPSCSEYAKQTLEDRGIGGIGKIIWRILRCNPYSKGGVDVS